MNIYQIEFFARCPTNDVRIKYLLRIETPDHQTIMVEELLASVNECQVGFHEAFADKFAQAFGGTQTLIAHHHGVEITTTRG